jgi:peptidyl-prolyl cis-trans isomerase B (cyclophilin B)
MSVASSKRERQLERARYERRQERRTAQRRVARKRQQIVAVVVSMVLVVGGAIVIAGALNGDSGTTTATPTSSPSTSSSAAAASCTYTKDSAGAPAKDVGIPTYDKTAAAAPYDATLNMNQGKVTFSALTTKAPCTTNSFRYLAEKGYYNGSPCHRLTTGGIFVLQCGDPTGTGSGGPGYTFGVENAPPDGKYPAGSIAMARTADPDSNGSQFFIVYKDSQLPTEGGGYSIFGTVTSGMDVVQKIAAGGVTGGGADGAPKTATKIDTVTINGKA